MLCVPSTTNEPGERLRDWQKEVKQGNSHGGWKKRSYKNFEIGLLC